MKYVVHEAEPQENIKYTIHNYVGYIEDVETNTISDFVSSHGSG